MTVVRIGIVAGELSGDYLGAGLMRELRRIYPDVQFEGIGGERMVAETMDSFYPMETLSVMGLAEVVRHLPTLLRIRRHMVRRFCANPPDAFIGIDAPDFNLGLEHRLKQCGIPTVHYVSPTVWAWRQGRVKIIRRAVDRMLSIFPFETDFLLRHGIPTTFVGHPLADSIAMQPDQTAARHCLGITSREPTVIALLPGSRMSEVTRLGPVFLATAQWLVRHHPRLEFIIPCATAAIQSLLHTQIQTQAAGLNIRLFFGQSTDCLAAADAVLLASGTATLETLLHKRPMVVAYKVAPVSAWLAKRLIRTDYIAMPNLIAKRPLVSEFVQHQARPDLLGPAILRLLTEPAHTAELRQAFTTIHQQLRCNANHQAAQAVAKLLATKYEVKG